MDDTSIEPVQVFIRIRPEIPEDVALSEHNLHSRHKCVTGLDEKTLRVDPPDPQEGRKNVPAVDSKLYTYDKVFAESSRQEDIYNSVSHHVRATIRGYNTTIFALGCTGSGKTFTMSGNSSAPGIVPRAISEIFSMIEATAAEEKDVYFYVRISLVELYNNNFRNLLDFASKELSDKDFMDTSMSRLHTRGNSPTSLHPSISSRTEKIEVRESQTAGVFLAGHNLRIPVTTAQEAFLLIAKGNKNRATGVTNCNDVSSRSHCILTIHVESRLSGSGGQASELRLGKMHLVDLAGSERLKLSGAEGDTLTETQNINLSLTALGDVLAALSHNAKEHGRVAAGKVRSPSRGPFAMMPVPYRNSKLTYLLKDSLGGNSKTTMITTICTLSEYYQQTLISLNYASRAKKVKNRSLVNRDVIGDSGIHAVTSEIERLRARLDDRTSEFDRLKAEHQRDASENISLKTRLQELNKANEVEKKQLEAQMSHVIHNQAGQLAAQRQRISALQTALQDELALSQNRIAEQEREIKWLKKALDDSTQAVQHPVEQIERMQKIIDAWQEQAKNAQDELNAVTASEAETRTRMLAMRSDLQAVESDRDEIRSELETITKRDAELRAALLSEQKARESAAAKASSVNKELLEIKSRYKVLVEEGSRKDTHNLELAQRREKVESELRIQLDKAEKRIIELTLKNEEVEEQNDELRKRVSSTMTSMEKQLLSVVEESRSSVRQAELRADIAEKRAKSIENELEMFKTKISGMQHDTQDIVLQRDSRISLMWTELQETKTAKDSIAKEYETQLSAKSQELAELKSRVAAAEQSAKVVSVESSKKAAEFAASLEARAIEVTELKKSYDKAIEMTVKQCEKKCSDLLIEISQLKEKHQLDLATERDILRQESTAQLESLSTEVSRIQEASLMTVAELKKSHNQEMESVRSRFKTSFEGQKKQLEAERDAIHADEILKIRAEAEAEKSEMLRRFEIELEDTRRTCEQETERAKEKTAELFEARKSAYEAELAEKLTRMESKHSEELEHEIERFTEKLRREHRSELQVLRSQHLQLMQDMERKYQNTSVELKSETELAFREQFALKEAELRRELALQLEQGNRAVEQAVNESNEKYKKKMQSATEALSAQMQDIQLQKASIEETVRTKVASEMKKVTDQLLASSEANYQETLAAQLELQRTVLLRERDEALDRLRVELEEKHSLELSASCEKWKLDSESEQKVVLKALLDSTRAELNARHSEYQAAMLKDHEASVKELHVKYSSELDEVKRLHEQKLTSAKLDVELVMGKDRELLLENLKKNLRVEHEAELKRCVSEIEQSHALRIQELEESLSESQKLLQAEHFSQLSALNESHMAELMKVRDDMSRKHSTEVAFIEERCEREIAAHVNEMDKKIHELSTELHNAEEKLRQRELDFSDILRTTLLTESKLLNDSHASHLQELEVLWQGKLSSTVLELDAKVNALQTKHMEEVELLKKDFEVKVSVAISKAETEKLQLLELSRSELQAAQTEHRKAFEEAERKAHDQMQTFLSLQRQEFEAREREKAAQHEANSMKLVSEALEKQKTLYALEIAEVTALKDKAIKELHERASSDVSSALSSQLDMLLTKHTREIDIWSQKYDDLKKAHELSIQSMSDDHDAIVLDLKTQIEQRRKSLVALEEQIVYERDSHEKYISAIQEQLKSEFANSSAVLKDKIAEHLCVVEELRTEIAILKSVQNCEVCQLNAEIDSMSKILKTATEEHEEILRRDRNLHVLEIENIKDEAARRVTAVQEERREAIEAITSKHQLEINNILESQRMESEKVRLEYRLTIDKTEKDLSDNITALRALNSELELRLDAANSERNETDLKCKDLILKAEQAKQEHMLELSDQQQMWESKMRAEIEGLQRELDVARTKCNEAELNCSNITYQVEQVKKKHTEELADQQRLWESKMHSELQALQKSLDERVSDDVRSVVQRVEQNVSSLQEAHLIERQRLLDDISKLDNDLKLREEMHAKEFVFVVSERQRIEESNIRKILENFEKERSALEQRIALLALEHDDAVMSIKAKHETEIEKLKSVSEEERIEYGDMLVKCQLESLIESQSDRISQINKDHELEVASLEAAYAEKLSELALTHDQEMHELTSCFSRENSEAISKLRDDYEGQLYAKEEHLKAIEKKMLAMLDSQLIEHEKAVQELEQRNREEILHIKSVHEYELDTLKKSIDIANEGSRMNDLQMQVQELLRLMQSTYDESKSTAPRMEDMHRKFLALFKETSVVSDVTSQYVADDSPSQRSIGSGALAHRLEKDHLSQRPDGSVDIQRHVTSEKPSNGADSDTAYVAFARPSAENVDYYALDDARQSIDSHRSTVTSASWISKGHSSKPSPNDQLVTAILDGDVQGIRSIVRSRGDTLHSPFWIEITKSILPLHRAISGLHFHGSDAKLIATLETLIQLGCNVKAVDHTGNTAVHKVLQVCTSTSVKTVLQCLLSKGASASTRNHAGDMPIHTECKRLRIASSDSIACLITHGADPCATCNDTCDSPDRQDVDGSSLLKPTALTPLSLVLRAAAKFQTDMIGKIPGGYGNRTENDYNLGSDDTSAGAKRGSYRVWVPSIGILLRAGAKWDKGWKDRASGYSQLHLLVQAFPPPREQAVAYRTIFASAIKAGLSALSNDNVYGRSALHVLCIQLGNVTPDLYPDAGNVLHAMLHACFDESARSRLGKLGARIDASGQTIFQIKESVPNSWLSLSQTLLTQAIGRMTGDTSMRGILLELNQPKSKLPLEEQNGKMRRRFPLEDAEANKNGYVLQKSLKIDTESRSIKETVRHSPNPTGIGHHVYYGYEAMKFSDENESNTLKETRVKEKKFEDRSSRTVSLLPPR